MQRNILTGQDFTLYDIADTPIAYSKNVALSIKQNLINVTTKQSNGWAESITGSRDFSISFQGLVSYDKAFDTKFFNDRIIAGTPFFIRLGVLQNVFNYSFYGEVSIESIDLTADYDGIASYEGSLKGVGALSFTNEGSPEQSGYLKVETDPIFVASPAYSITNQNKSDWQDAKNKTIEEVQFVENASLTTLNLRLTDGSNYTSSFRNVNSIDLSGLAGKAETLEAIAAAQADADIANLLLANIADDSKLMPGEKPNVVKEWLIIKDEKPNLIAQALIYKVATIDYSIAYQQLEAYLLPLIADITTISNIDSTIFRDTFRKYYDEKVLLLKAFGEAQKIYVDSIQFGLRNYFLNGARTKYVNSVNPVLLQDGNFETKTEYAFSFLARSTAGVSTLLLNFEGQTANSFDITGEWKKYTVVASTGNSIKLFAHLSDVIINDKSFPYSLPIRLNFGVEMKDVMIVAGNKPIDFNAAPEDFYDLINQATADLIIKYTTAIDVANTAALNTAQADATAKAEVAKNASIASAKSYTNAQATLAQEIANAYADGIVTAEEQARITQAQNNLEAAKLDATNKANVAAAYGQAAQNLHNALVNNLRGLAYEDVVEVGKLGTTIVSGGYIKGTLLDVEYIKASIINAEYINALVTTSNTLQTSETGKRVVISGTQNNMVFYDENNNEALRIDSQIDSGNAGVPLGGMRMNTPAGDTAYCSGNGFFANGSGMRFLPPSTGVDTNASLVGLLRYRNSTSTGISAGVVGYDQTTTGSGKSYGVASLGKTLLTGEIHLNMDGSQKGWTGSYPLGNNHFIYVTNGIITLIS